MKDAEGKNLFTCKSCGSNQLKVVLKYITITTVQESMDCSCTEGMIAATRRVKREESWKEEFELAGDHRWSQRVGVPSNIASTDEEAEVDVSCGKCYMKNTWTGEADDLSGEPYEIDGSREHTVACMGCNREIPFGWSRAGPDGKGAGLIWPAECTDFDAKLVFMDPRYKEGGS